MIALFNITQLLEDPPSFTFALPFLSHILLGKYAVIFIIHSQIQA